MATERRPDHALLVYYIISSLILGPLFWFPLLPLYFRYHTLRYVFDEQGISMSWGIIFRREVSLTFARIQDIHLTSNIFERWLGLAKVQIQTASGSADAEMTIEGLKDYEQIRDYLYSKMRGTASTRPASSVQRPASNDVRRGTLDAGDDVVSVLREIADEVRALRSAIEKKS